jgi:hypothetical protein
MVGNARLGIATSIPPMMGLAAWEMREVSKLKEVNTRPAKQVQVRPAKPTQGVRLQLLGLNITPRSLDRAGNSADLFKRLSVVQVRYCLCMTVQTAQRTCQQEEIMASLLKHRRSP